MVFTVHREVNERLAHVGRRYMNLRHEWSLEWTAAQTDGSYKICRQKGLKRFAINIPITQYSQLVYYDGSLLNKCQRFPTQHHRLSQLSVWDGIAVFALPYKRTTHLILTGPPISASWESGCMIGWDAISRPDEMDWRKIPRGAIQIYRCTHEGTKRQGMRSL